MVSMERIRVEISAYWHKIQNDLFKIIKNEATILDRDWYGCKVVIQKNQRGLGELANEYLIVNQLTSRFRYITSAEETNG